MRWSWTDVYAGHRVLTLVLPAWEAEKLLDQAALEGRLIAPAVIRGLPGIAFDRSQDDDRRDLSPGPEEGNDCHLIRPVADTITAEPGATPENTGGGARMATQAARQFTGTTRRETDADGFRPAPGSILAERPPAPAREPAAPARRFNPVTRRWQTHGEITAEDLKLVDEAVRAGRVTHCPPRTFSTPAGAAPGGWGNADTKARARAARRFSKAGRPRKEPNGG